MPPPRPHPLRFSARLWPGAALSLVMGLLGGLAVPSLAATANAQVVRYPGPISDKDTQDDYMRAVLRLGLDKSGHRYQLKANSDRMQQARAIQDILDGKNNLDLLWTMTTDEREAQLLPVRIPLDKGLIGWRIALLRREQPDLFKQVRRLSDLRLFSAGQEHDWPDTPILKSNVLPVVTSSSYEALFGMLKARRFDYFPRGVIEIWHELDSRPDSGLVADEELVLHYPAAIYFFVSPRLPQLAEDLRAGLEKAVADGSFEKLFQRYQQAAIQRTNLKKRRVIELNNPLLKPGSLPLNRPELWFKP